MQPPSQECAEAERLMMARMALAATECAESLRRMASLATPADLIPMGLRGRPAEARWLNVASGGLGQ